MCFDEILSIRNLVVSYFFLDNSFLTSNKIMVDNPRKLLTDITILIYDGVDK